MIWLAILALGLGAGTLAGIVGFGASMILMPALMLTFGPRKAVPIMAVAGLMANVSRVMVWWREVDWRACAAYSVTAIPAAALGASTLVIPPRIAEGVARRVLHPDDPGAALDDQRTLHVRPGSSPSSVR